MSHDFDLVEKKQHEILLQPDIPKQFSIWQHYKGELYYVQGLVMKESTEELEVCYSKLGRSLPCPWSRPISEWNESVKNGDGTYVKRFTKIQDDTRLLIADNTEHLLNFKGFTAAIN